MSQKTKKLPVEFVAFVPNRIEPADNYEPRLVGFPFNILFAGILKDKQTGERSLVSVCYWPVPDTFREDSERKEMFYFTKPPNDYFIRVTFEKSNGLWRTEKFRGNKLIQTAEGRGFDGVMLHTTMGGLEPDECPGLENTEFELDDPDDSGWEAVD